MNYTGPPLSSRMERLGTFRILLPAKYEASSFHL